MKFILVIPEMGSGGAERVVADLARTLRNRGDQVTLIAAPGPGDALLDDLALDRIPLPDKARSPGGAIANIAAVRRFVRRCKPDLVQAMNVKATAISGVAARLGRPGRRPRLVASFQGVAADEYRASARILRLADVVVCVSNELAGGLADAGYPRDRLAVIPNAVPLLPALSDAARDTLDADLQLGDGPVVVNVGRLVEQKDHFLFLDVAARVRESIPASRFLIVGEGKLRHDLERRVRELELDAAVTFTGFRNDARTIISRADLVVFTSHWEGLSLGALEALAAGVPVVSTAAHGMEELLDAHPGEEVGALVRSRDADGIAKVVTDLLTDHETREAMGARGRERIAAQYSVDRMVGDYLRLYDRVLG